MKKRWQVSEDNIAFIREVNPSNGAKLKITESRDLDAGQIFYRKKISGGILFAEKADYEYFRGFERLLSGRCQPLYIRLQFYCHGLWQTFWTGEFSTGAGKWNLDECTFEVKPETVDRYSCLLRKMDVKHNVLNTDVVTANVVAFPPGMEISFGISSPGLPADDGWLQVDTQTINYPAIPPFPAGSVTQGIYWRETAITLCVDGVPVQPAGDGWEQIYDSFCTDGFVRWGRIPSVPWPFADDPLFIGPVVTGAQVPPDSPECSNWYKVGDINPPGTGAAGIYICLDDADSQFIIERARKVDAGLSFLLDQSGCELEGIRSDFFEWNPVGDAEGYSAGVNYITGTANELAHLLLFQKSDVMDPDATNPATIGEMSFREAMTMLTVMFQCYWDIDTAGYVRIEHWKYWTQDTGIDIHDHAKDNELMQYQYLVDDIPQIERLKFMEARGEDFVGKDIAYSGPCVKSDAREATKDYSPGKITTDISFVLSEPTAISKDGFVILASVYNGVDYDSQVGVGALTNSPITNAALSTANLQRDYWTWNRYLRAGNMNGADVVFDGSRANIEQANVRLTTCCEILRMDAKDTVGTRLGDHFGSLRGTVEAAEYELISDRLTLTLRYTRA